MLRDRLRLLGPRGSSLRTSSSLLPRFGPVGAGEPRPILALRSVYFVAPPSGFD